MCFYTFFWMKTVFPSNVLFWMTTEIWQHLCGSTSTHGADHEDTWRMAAKEGDAESNGSTTNEIKID